MIKKDIQYTLYKIYYGEELVYVGRTKQPLQDRIRGHVFKQRMMRAIDIDKVTKIEYAYCNTEADMFFYEIYYINLFHPKLNRDDKARDELTVRLPDLTFQQFDTHLWDKWKSELHKRDFEDIVRQQKLKQHQEEKRAQRKDLLNQYTNQEFDEDTYWDKLKELEEWDAKFLYELGEIDFFEYKDRMGFKEADIL